MAETRCLPLPIIEEDEIIDDDFYEKIQAPKFVDFTAPDLRPSDDDRHWFCLRFGCDQKHEQELDPEAIYKNFVLRVMAARSPNVRLRKALNRKEASSNLKCPLSAPAKPRVSRTAFISSLPHKMTDTNVKAKPLSSKDAAATPNAKVKQSSSVAKALTTPRNPKKASNVERFRTVQSKKGMTVVVPKSKAVAKALVFHSPKKAVKIKSSVELNTAMKALCSAMKKLEVNGVKKNGEGCNNSLPVAASRKQFRGREVKSRVFDSLYANNRKGPETNNVRCLKEKKVKGTQKRQVTVPHEEAENDDSSDMEIDEKSRGGSLERCHDSGTSGESSVLVLSGASRDDITSLSGSNEEENKITGGSGNDERTNPVSEKGKVHEATKRKDEENSMAFDNKENKVELTENDNKENASAPDENRAMITNNDDPKKAIPGSNHEDSRKTHKKSTSTSTGAQVVKYRKLKPTNPKPFKLRTDERGILKEANVDKKVPSTLRETTAKGGKAVRKHQNVNRVSEQDTDNNSSRGEKANQITQENQSESIQSDNSNGNRLQRHRLSATTLYRNPGPNLLEHREKAVKNLDNNFNRTSQMMQRKVVRPRGALSRKKEKVLLATPCKLSVIIEKPSNSNIVKPKEAAKPRHQDASSPKTTSKAADSPSRPCSRGRRALTVPKEPKFQSLHVPKSCTTRKQT